MATQKEDKTTLDSDVTKPQVTAPGDAPYDTTDPSEFASTVTPQPGKEALKAGTVNGAVPIDAPNQAVEVPEDEARFEEYDAVKPDGTKIRVRRNIETGASSIVTK